MPAIIMHSGSHCEGRHRPVGVAATRRRFDGCPAIRGTGRISLQFLSLTSHPDPLIDHQFLCNGLVRPCIMADFRDSGLLLYSCGIVLRFRPSVAGDLVRCQRIRLRLGIDLHHSRRERLSFLNALISILQNRDTFVEEIANGTSLKRKIIDLNLLAASCFAVYGLIIGSQHGFMQAISSSVKLPILFLLTTVICMPTLFVFSSFFGSKCSVLQTFVLLATGMAIIAVALIGFAPVSLFFILTTRSYQFFKLLNVVFFAISGLLGVLFFNHMYEKISESNTPEARSRRVFLRLWLLLFGFVGTQLGWTLRPFFGSPGLPFEIVRQVGGNFYTDVFQSLGQLFGQS